MDIGALVGGAMNLIGSGVGAIVSGVNTNKTNQANREMFDANMAWQKEENQITRDREDNAVQRRAADLEKAGINPMIAGLGQGAQAGLGGVVTPPQMQQNNVGEIIAGMQLGSSIADIKLKNAQVKKTEAETDNIEEQTTHAKNSNPVILENMRKEGVKLDAETTNIIEDTQLKKSNQLLNSANTLLIDAKTDTEREQAKKTAQETAVLVATMEYTYKQIESENGKIEYQKLINQLTEQELIKMAQDLAEREMELEVKEHEHEGWKKYGKSNWQNRIRERMKTLKQLTDSISPLN